MVVSAGTVYVHQISYGAVYPWSGTRFCVVFLLSRGKFGSFTSFRSRSYKGIVSGTSKPPILSKPTSSHLHASPRLLLPSILIPVVLLI